MRKASRFSIALIMSVLALSTEAATGAESAPALKSPFGRHVADYDAELRGKDRRVDTDALLARLKELGVTTYYWLIWHAPTDWDDLKLFLPRARDAGIQVWVYLVPPTESGPGPDGRYSEPFRLDYQRWAEEIARLSRNNPNLTAFVIDDFYANSKLFTPAYLRAMRERYRRINPRLAFLPLMYPGELEGTFAEDYHAVIDGVVVAYLRSRDEIAWARAVLNDATSGTLVQLAFPWSTVSRPGDYVMASQSARVLPAERYVVRFMEQSDYTGPTAGYHVKQLLVDGQVCWEEDVAGGSHDWRDVEVDLTDRVRGKQRVTLAFRLIDQRGVSNFGVRWQLGHDLRAEGLRLDSGTREPQRWHLSRQGVFTASFGPPVKARHRFRIPLISMTAASPDEFRLRHGDPASPERIARWLKMSLDAWKDGLCDGVVTYCLDKNPSSQTYPLARDLIRRYAARIRVR